MTGMNTESEERMDYTFIEERRQSSKQKDWYRKKATGITERVDTYKVIIPPDINMLTNIWFAMQRLPACCNSRLGWLPRAFKATDLEI